MYVYFMYKNDNVIPKCFCTYMQIHIYNSSAVYINIFCIFLSYFAQTGRKEKPCDLEIETK